MTTTSTTMLMLMLLLILLQSFFVVITDAALQVGDNICVEGYIMDFFCIDRGTLLDAPSVRTLENPELHSFHCLIDVNSCVTSPFEVLLDPSTNDGDDLYNRGFRLDDASKQQAIALAQSVGSCSTCINDNDAADSHKLGFRAVMNATILNLNVDDASIPPTLQLHDIEDTTAFIGSVKDTGDSACVSYFDMIDILDVPVEDSNSNNNNNNNEPQNVDNPSEANDDTELSLQAGDNICVEGFIMDFFCIDRGTLLDAPTVKTLVNPELHSIHCLIDVNSCVTSPFEVLVDPNGDKEQQPQLYNRGWRLDDDSKQQAIALAQNVGSCTTCVNGSTENADFHKLGFRAVINATILDLNANDDSTPPTLMIHAIEDTTTFVGSAKDTGGKSACLTYYGMEDIIDIVAASKSSASSSGGGGGSVLDGFAVGANTPASSRSSRHTKVMAHAILMLLGWGFLLPSGTLIAKFFKHRPDGMWFKLHRGIQTLGLLLALLGWIIALVNFNVFKDYGLVNYQHGICGMTVMILGLLQPLNALLRPHGPASPSDDKSKHRIMWELWHKTSGWVAVGLAIPTIALGTMTLAQPKDQTKFQIGYGVGCGGALLLLIAVIFYDKKNYEQDIEKQEQKQKFQKGVAVDQEETIAP